MKSNFKKKTVLSIIPAIILISQIFCFSVGAKVNPVVTSLDLINPIKFTSSTKSPSKENTDNALSVLKSISQTAYDAFVMDNPRSSMWMDINSVEVKISPTGFHNGNQYVWRITNLKNVIYPLPIYSDTLSPYEITEKLDLAINSFVPQGNTMFERVKSIHDYICEINVYDLNAAHRYNAYGALVDKRSVCEGYAEAFKLLCDNNGIECILVFGKGVTSNDIENHMWNYVKMDDDKWYAVDVTWDDKKASYSSTYLLVGSDTVVNISNNTLFSDNHIPSGNISDTSFKSFVLPELSLNSYLENSVYDSEIETEIKPDQHQIQNKNGNINSTNKYYYNQLNSEQKNFYNMLLSISPPRDNDIISTTDSSQTSLPDSTELNETSAPSFTTEVFDDSVFGTEATDNFIITIVGHPIEDTTPTTLGTGNTSKLPVSFFRIFIIVLAILSIMLFISVVFIRFQRNNKN